MIILRCWCWVVTLAAENMCCLCLPSSLSKGREIWFGHSLYYDSLLRFGCFRGCLSFFKRNRCDLSVLSFFFFSLELVPICIFLQVLLVSKTATCVTQSDVLHLESYNS